MSKVVNMVGGGSSGGGISSNDAVLLVTVPTGSTVTATKGGVALTPTIWVTAADPTLDCAIFIIKASLFDAVNPWTVTATRGGSTASTTVLITTNKEYEATLSYELILVQNGIVQSGVSLANNVSYGEPNALLTVTQGDAYTRLKTNTGWPAVWSTTNKINISAYSTMTIRFVAQSLSTSPPAALRGAGIGVMNNTFQGNGGSSADGLANAITAYANTQNSSANIQTVTLDISNYSEMYLVVICSAWSNTNSQVDVYDWRLE